MRWPLVSRRRFEAVGADRERLRGERDQFAKDRDAALRFSAETELRRRGETLDPPPPEPAQRTLL